MIGRVDDVNLKMKYLMIIMMVMSGMWSIIAIVLGVTRLIAGESGTFNDFTATVSTAIIFWLAAENYGLLVAQEWLHRLNDDLRATLDRHVESDLLDRE